MRCHRTRRLHQLLVRRPGRNGPGIAKAGDKLNVRIVKACGRKDTSCGTNDTGESAPAAIGWNIESCPHFENGTCTNPINNCSDIPACIECISEAAVDHAIDLYYASLTKTDPKTEKDLNKCQAAIGKSAAKCLATKSKTLAKCWAIVGSLQELIDCVDCVTEFDVDCADRAAVPGFVHPYPAECNPAATATSTPSPTPTVTPTP